MWFSSNFGILLPTTVGSKSTKTARGTCFPAPVSLKNVLKESSPPPMVLSLGIWPSGWIPCSKQYNSQQAFPIWTPAWPTWTEIHSRCEKSGNILIKFVTTDNVDYSTCYCFLQRYRFSSVKKANGLTGNVSEFGIKVRFVANCYKL